MKKKYLLALLPSIFYINSISAEDSTPKENPVLNKNEKHMNGYDTNGNPISIDTSSLIKDYVSGKIYSQDGSVYVDKGTYEIWDNRGKTIIKDCSKSLLLTDPYVEPSAELGELPGPECYFQKIKYHEDGSEYETIKYQEDGSEYETTKKKLINSPQKNTNDSKKQSSSFKSYNCSSFYGYAPPIAWSKPIIITSHVGPTNYKVTVTPKGDTEIFSWIRFYGTKDRWIKYKFRKSANISTGNVAASVKISFNGIPFGSVVTGNIC